MNWQPIDSAPEGVDVDLWRDGERLIEFRLVRGRWEKKHGYPAVTTVLMIPPSHWMLPPAPPASPSGGPTNPLNEREP